MANTAQYVTTGKPKISGAVFVAPISTTQIPTDATTDLGSDFVCLGYVSDNGLTNDNSMDVSAIKAWGGVTVLRSLTGLEDIFSLTLIESQNADVLEAVYGSEHVSVNSSGMITVDVVAEDPEEKVWVFDLTLRGGVAKRIVIPDGAITSREAINYNDTDPVGYGISVSAYPDADGKTHSEYIEGVSTPSI